MNKLLLIASVLVCLVIFMGASDFRSPRDRQQSPLRPRNCTGSTIIEYGKAFNCKGDTIRLIHENGFGQISATR
ncbi:MAG TPA: hypothetical protein VF490_18335 [Chryseosolibacter sp.]